MRSWRDVEPEALRGVQGILTDIDDTLTRDGAIEPMALTALQSLSQASIPVLAITGRPIGWSEEIAADWPVHAVVAENGGVALMRNDTGRVRYFMQDEATRTLNTRRLQTTAVRILREVPGARLARDSVGRVTDIAIDHSEFEQMDPASIAQVLAIMRDEGMKATVSSIHINGWYGDHDKWRGACWVVNALYGRRLEDECATWIYVGDSSNDQIMFQRFALSVGVANLMQAAGHIEHWPAYLTDGERGEGFAEVARAVLRSRIA